MIAAAEEVLTLGRAFSKQLYSSSTAAAVALRIAAAPAKQHKSGIPRIWFCILACKLAEAVAHASLMHQASSSSGGNSNGSSSGACSEVFSLLLTCLKYSTSLTSMPLLPGSCCPAINVLDAAAQLVMPQSKQVIGLMIVFNGNSTQSSTSSSSNEAGSASCSTGSSSTSSEGAHASAQDLHDAAAPSLALIGRAMLLCGEGLMGASYVLGGQSGELVPREDLKSWIDICCGSASAVKYYITKRLSLTSTSEVADRAAWERLLGESSKVEAEFSAAKKKCDGPDIEVSVVQAVDELRRLVGGDLARQLVQLGEGLVAELPLLYCCNNPRCVNLGMVSEVQLVMGTSSRCSGCRAAAYCSRRCQVAHWKQGHKEVCKRMEGVSKLACSLQGLSLANQ